MIKKNNHEENKEANKYKQVFNRSLTVWDMTIYGLVFMVPIAPMGIYGIIYNTSHGMVVLAYVLGLIGMLLTANNYAEMSKKFPYAGSVFTYVENGISKPLGFIAGWMIFLDYILVPALLYLVAGNAFVSFLKSLMEISNESFILNILVKISTYQWVLIFATINTIICILGIKLTAKINKYILAIELLVLVIFCLYAVIAISKGVNNATWNLKPIFNPEYFNMTSVAAATAIAVLSFLGFDGISTLAEETKDGPKSVGRAMIMALIVISILFIIQTYLAALISNNIPYFSNQDNAFYWVASIVGGNFLVFLVTIITVIAWGFATAIAAQSATSRLLYGMAREGTMPNIFTKIHHKYKSPYVSIVFIALLSITIASFISIPVLTKIVNLGALTSFTMLAFSVISYFMIKHKSKQYIKHLIFPIMAIIVLCYVIISMGISSYANPILIEVFGKTIKITVYEVALVWFFIGVLFWIFFQSKVKKRYFKSR